jgi:hypothetical protein
MVIAAGLDAEAGPGGVKDEGVAVELGPAPAFTEMVYYRFGANPKSV